MLKVVVLYQQMRILWLRENMTMAIQSMEPPESIFHWGTFDIKYLLPAIPHAKINISSNKHQTIMWRWRSLNVISWYEENVVLQ